MAIFMCSYNIPQGIFESETDSLVIVNESVCNSCLVYHLGLLKKNKYTIKILCTKKVSKLLNSEIKSFNCMLITAEEINSELCILFYKKNKLVHYSYDKLNPFNFENIIVENLKE